MELKNLSYYFDLSGFRYKDVFENCEYVFDFIKFLPEYIKKNLKTEILGTVMPGAYVDKMVFIGRGTVVQPGAWINGPAIIGENCEIRHGAYVGANTLIGDKVIIGHASEVSNSIFLNESRAAHFAFVGHSILGNKVNLGAGTKLSNYKITASEIIVEGINTHLTKIGAIIGDGSSFGCNSVTQPASFIGKSVYTYPLSLVRGFVPSNTILKVRQQQELGTFDSLR